MTNQQLLRLAEQAALSAGPLFVKNFGATKHVKLKNGDFRNQVTEIDLAIEKRIRSVISKKMPQAKFIGEEMSPDNKDLADIFWIIDPIDGTTNYIQKIPLCCISIAAWDKHGPLAGVLYNPLTKEMLTAAKGRGAYKNGRKIKVSASSEITLALGGLGWFNINNAKQLFNAVIKKVRKIRVLATSAWQLGMVAMGSYDFYLASNIHIWDVAAGILIIEEAGGKVTSLDNKKIGLNIRSIAGSNGKLHSKLLKLSS